MTLYELTAEYKALLELAEDPDTDPQTLADTMESISGEIEDKADSYAAIIRTLNGEAEIIDVEMRRLAGRKLALLANAERMKNRLQESMIAADKKKFKTARFSFGIQKNPAAVVIDAATEFIPDAYLIPQAPKIDKKAIAAALKAGEVMEFAHLEQTESLRIR